MRVATISNHFWNKFFISLSILYYVVISVQSKCPEYGMRNAHGDATSNWEFFQVQDSNISISCLLCARWTSSVLSTFELIIPCRDGDMSLVGVSFGSFSFVRNAMLKPIGVQWINIAGSDCKSVYNTSSVIDSRSSSSFMMGTFVKKEDEPSMITIPVENLNEAHLLRVQGTYSENSIVCLTDVSLRYTSISNPSTDNVAVTNGSTTTEDFDMSATDKSATTPGVETSDEGMTFHPSDVTPSGKVSDSSKRGTTGFTQYSTTTSTVVLTSLTAQATSIGFLIAVVMIVVCVIALFLAGAVFLKRFHVKRRVKQSDNMETRSLDPESDVNRKQLSPDIGQMEINNEAFETTFQDEVIFTHLHENKDNLVGEHNAIVASSDYAEINKRSPQSKGGHPANREIQPISTEDITFESKDKVGNENKIAASSDYAEIYKRSQQYNRDHPTKREFQAPSTRDNEHIKKGNNVYSELHTNTQVAISTPAKTKTKGGVVPTSKLTSLTDGEIIFDKDGGRSKMRREKEDIRKTKNYIVVKKNEDGNLSENSRADKHHPVADEKILGQNGESFEKDSGFHVEDEYSEVSDKLERRTSAPKYGEIAKDDTSPQVKYKFHVADKPNLPEVPNYGTVDRATKIDNVQDSKVADGLSEVYMEVPTNDESPSLNTVKSESSQSTSLQENVGRFDEEGTSAVPEDKLVHKKAEMGQMGASMESHRLLLDSDDQYCEIPAAVDKASDSHATADVSPAQRAGDNDSGMDPTNTTANLTRLRKDRRPSIYVEYDNRNHNLADAEDEYSEVADARKRVTQVYAEVGTNEAGTAINNRDDNESEKNKNESFPTSTPTYRDVGKRKMDSAKANNHELIDEYGAVADALKRVTPIYAEVETDERGIPPQSGRDEASGIKRTILPSISTPIYGGVVKPNSRDVIENSHSLATDDDYGEVADAVKRITPVYAEVKDDMLSPETGHDRVHEMQRNKSPAINVPIYGHTTSSKSNNSAASSSEVQNGEVSDALKRVSPLYADIGDTNANGSNV